MNNISYDISADQANSLFKIVCDPNGPGFRIKGPEESMSFKVIQTALASFIGRQMHSHEIKSRLSDTSIYGPDRMRPVPEHRRLESAYTSRYASQPITVSRLAYKISSNPKIDKICKAHLSK